MIYKTKSTYQDKNDENIKIKRKHFKSLLFDLLKYHAINNIFIKTYLIY